MRLAEGQFIDLQERSRERDGAIAKLTALNTPKVSLKFLEVTETSGEDGAVYTVVLLFTGLSHEPTSVELWCTDIKVQSPGDSTLSILNEESGRGCVVYREERRCVDAVRFDWKRNEPGHMDVLIPCKLTANNSFRGKEFRISFTAYGAMVPIELELLCGFRDDGRLHAEQVMKQSAPDIQG